ncbi:hypothetical protein EJB05_55992, partial [Eragrostis curvula]
MLLSVFLISLCVCGLLDLLRGIKHETHSDGSMMDPNNSSELELLDMICEMSEDPLNLSVPCPSIAEPSLETQTQSADDNSLANPNPSRSKKKLHVE